MRQMSVISGHPIFTGLRKLTGCQRDPRDRGVTLLVKEHFVFLLIESMKTCWEFIKM